MSSNPTCFLSCDWGTSSFRLRLVWGESGDVLEQVITDTGVKKIAQSLTSHASGAERARAFHNYLAGQTSRIIDQAVPKMVPSTMVISGMASSSVGWMELPYAGLPFPVDGSGTQTKALSLNLAPNRLLPVLLVSGVATDREIMRGEETQLIGLLSSPEWQRLAEDSLVLLPGTHSKHIRVQKGNITNLQTYLTGELFQVLCDHSILQFTTGTEAEPFDEANFCEGVKASKSPGIARSLFQVRTRGVLEGKPAAANRGYLSGLLMGMECMDLDPHDNSTPVLVAACGHMTTLYRLTAKILDWKRPLLVTSEEDLNRAVVDGHRLYLKNHS